MEKVIENYKRITPTLKDMNVGDKETFCFSQFPSIQTTIYRVQVAWQKKFSYSVTQRGIEVTRTV